ncbi:MAG: F0F1 ATP synthase subunit delta [bacterium]
MTLPESTAQTIVKFLKDNGQYDQLPAITEILQKEAIRSQRISIISAVAVPEKERKELEATLFKKWGEHETGYTVDESLLSGMLIRYQNQLLDLTGKGSLTQLSQALK